MAGALIARLERDLPPLPAGLQMRERVESHFLMHVVTAEFHTHVPSSAVERCTLRIRHTGLWRRTGIECRVREGRTVGSLSIARRVRDDGLLQEALLPLDFTTFELRGVDDGWDCRLAHFGACEVVHRFPASRHYVRLPPQQADLLFRTFSRLRTVLST